MTTAQNILVATDFTVLGQAVVEHAHELALMLDAKLHVVTVYTPVGAMPLANPETNDLREQLAAVESRFKPSGRVAHAVIRYGEPAEGILRAATEFHADMIVMGTNNRRGFSRLAMGSTAPDVLREARVPVLVLKKSALRAHAGA